MEEINFTAGREGLNFTSAVEAIIKRSCIIDFGIVQKVRDGVKGIVDVSLAVAMTKQSMTIMTCVLANIASDSFTLDITPHVGDRVLVVYPRAYDDKMFSVPADETKKADIIVNENVKGYNLTTGIAILFNQYKKATHKNLVQIEDGKINLQLGYDKENEVNNLTISTDENGAIELGLGYDKENEVNHLSISAGADGAINIKNDATTLTLGADGELKAEVGYDSENEIYASVLTAKPDGSVSIDASYDTEQSKFKGSATIGADGYLSYKQNVDASTELSFTDSGMTMQDVNGCKVESSSEGVIINGKLKVNA